MHNSPCKILNNIFPEVLYAVERECNSSWYLVKTTLDFHNFMLIYDGEATFFKNGTMFKGKRGDLIYYKPGDVREAYSSDTFPMKCFAVEFLYTCPILSDSGWHLSSQKLPFNSTETIDDTYLFRKLLDLFSQLVDLKLSIKTTTNPTTAVIKERAIFMEILALLFQYKKGNQCNYRHSNQYNYFNIKRIEKVIDYMIQNYSKPLNLKTLADYLEISPSYLGSIFKNITGKSVISYLIDIRINKAKQFLRDGLSVSETARKTGFNDIFYFSRIFKKRVGITPSEFIKESESTHNTFVK